MAKKRLKDSVRLQRKNEYRHCSPLIPEPIFLISVEFNSSRSGRGNAAKWGKRKIKSRVSVANETTDV